VDGPLDDTDLTILDEVAEAYSSADPMPDGLIDRIRFAVALEEVNAEVLQLIEESELTTSARGERGRIFTFSSAILTVMIRVIGITDDTVRIDGWLAPPAAHRITLRSPQARVERTADDEGRFVFEQTSGGLAQLIVKIAGEPRGMGKTLASLAVVL
jgi:hypothetical protein